MLEYAQERLADALDDIKALVPAQSAEMAQGYERFVPEPNWPAYLAVEARGAGLLVTARDEGRLVGYLGFMLHPHASAISTMAASSTPYYVVAGPNRGLVLRRLLCVAKQLLEQRKVSMMTVRTHPWASAAPLLEAMRFRQTDTIWMLELDHA